MIARLLPWAAAAPLLCVSLGCQFVPKNRLDAAEDDLGLPLTLGGPRFAYRPDRHRLRGRP